MAYDNQLYITGRLKELVIVRGKKYSPSDLEETLRSVLCYTADPAAAPAAAAVAALPHGFSVRPGGILTTERVDRQTNHAELVCFVELNHDVASNRSAASSYLASTFTTLLTSLATSLFRQSKHLSPVVQGGLLRCGARVGARVQKWVRKLKSVHPASTSSSSSSSSSPSSSGPSLATISPFSPLLALIKQTLLSHYGLACSSIYLCQRGTLLKTSSGKLRRAATLKRLEKGGLESKILCVDNAPIAAAAAIVEASPKTHANGVCKKSSVASAPIDATSAARNAPVGSTPATFSSSPRQLLTHDKIRESVVSLIAEELQVDIDTLLRMASTLPTLSRDALLDDNAAAGALSSLGLDSLRAMQLASKINHEFALPLPLSPFMLFENPTFDGLVELIWKLQHQPESVNAHHRAESATPVQSPVESRCWRLVLILFSSTDHVPLHPWYRDCRSRSRRAAIDHPADHAPISHRRG